MDFGHTDFQIRQGEQAKYCDLIGCHVEFGKSNWLIKADHKRKVRGGTS